MTDKISFYHNPQSRSTMVHWMLEEVGADYDVVPIGFEDGGNRKPDFLKINPMGKIPAIVVGKTVITETPAIIAWLADAYPKADLAPPVGSNQRGSYYRWLFFGGSCIEPALTDEMFKRPMPERKSAVGWGTYDDVVDTLEKALQPGLYLVGDKFSAADLYIASELNFATMMQAPRMADSKPISDYVKRCTGRPAFQRTQQT